MTDLIITASGFALIVLLLAYWQWLKWDDRRREQRTWDRLRRDANGLPLDYLAAFDLERHS